MQRGQNVCVFASPVALSNVSKIEVRHTDLLKTMGVTELTLAVTVVGAFLVDCGLAKNCPI